MAPPGKGVADKKKSGATAATASSAAGKRWLLYAVLVAVLGTGVTYLYSRPAVVTAMRAAVVGPEYPAKLPAHDDQGCCSPPAAVFASPEFVKVGLVSTIKGVPSSYVYQWLCYHLKIGVSRIYLYVDRDTTRDARPDPAEEVAKIFGDRVVVTVRDPAYAQTLRTSRVWYKWGAFYKTEVMSRQNLNVEHAISAAHADGMEYMLHLDSDELFYTGTDSLLPHFAMLRRTNTTSGAYLNYEAMHANDDSDYFLESTFFKRNLISIGHNDPRLQQWQQSKGGVFLQGYWTGKGSVRLPPKGTPRDELPLPIEVTRFYVYGVDKRINFDGPVILHYINPSLPALRIKYGHIDPANGGGAHRIQEKNFPPSEADPEVLEGAKKFKKADGSLPPTHTLPHEAGELHVPLMLKRTVASGGIKALAQPFRQLAVLTEADRARWLGSGLLAHIPQPSALIRDSLVCAIGESGRIPQAKFPAGSPVPPAAVFRVPAGEPQPCLDRSYMTGHLADTVKCLAHTDCCTMIKTSKGSLKTPPYLY